MINHVLFVCVGNICRSPIAEVILRQRLGNPAQTIESAGLAALTGHPVDPLAESVLAEQGMTAASHVARQVTPEMIGTADMVLVMDKRHMSAVHALAPHARGKTFLLGHWQNDLPIPDPYGQQRPAFEQTFSLVDTAIDQWIKRF
jgi:low molecular weight protein-tyrosine phosphatase